MNIANTSCKSTRKTLWYSAFTISRAGRSQLSCDFRDFKSTHIRSHHERQQGRRSGSSATHWTRTNRATPYGRDVILWSQEQARLLRAGRFAELDIEHLADEIEDVGKSEKRELASRMAVLLGPPAEMAGAAREPQPPAGGRRSSPHKRIKRWRSRRCRASRPRYATRTGRKTCGSTRSRSSKQGNRSPRYGGFSGGCRDRWIRRRMRSFDRSERGGGDCSRLDAPHLTGAGWCARARRSRRRGRRGSPSACRA